MTLSISKTEYSPEHLSRWSKDGPTCFDSSANYAGEDKSEFYIAPVGINRDTQDIRILSNWEVQNKILDDLIEHEESGITCFGHWGCGWYELYLIHESDYAALEQADELACDIENYCVLDEDNYNDKFMEAQGEEYERYYAEEFYKKFSNYIKDRVDDSVFESFVNMYDEDDYVEDLIRNAAERQGIAVEAYLYQKFYDCMSRNNIYWEDTYEGVSIDIDRVCQFSPDDVSDILHPTDKNQVALF